MTRDVAREPATTMAAPLTDQQRVVLQAVYDHFRMHGTWPTFITIDRPIRRQHHWDTGAIILSISESLVVPPRQRMRPIATDELRLRLLGVQACDGSSDDLERFVQTLRWLAEREEAYEPPPGSGDEMPQVTSQEVAQHLALGADPLPLQRLYAMLDLDHWGIGGRSSSKDGWSVRLMPDIWRFREVRSVEDCVAAREAWLAEGRPAVHMADDTEQDGYFHVRLGVKGRSSKYRVLPDLSLETLEVQILAPYRTGRAIVTTDGDIIQLTDVTQIRIVRTEHPTEELPMRRALHAQGVLVLPSNDKWSLATNNGKDVTNDFITGAPGQPVVEAIEHERLPLPAQVGSPYVNEKVIKAIRAKDGQSTFDVTKLLALVGELNDNYSRSNTYASHALLRAILDHIPPILGQPHFDAVASNYRWMKTDKKYMQQLAAFRAQGDDALHRQISADADLLGFDDMPKSVCVDQLLLECAKKL